MSAFTDALGISSPTIATKPTTGSAFMNALGVTSPTAPVIAPTTKLPPSKSPFNPKNSYSQEYNAQLDQKTQGPVKNFFSSIVPAAKQVGKLATDLPINLAVGTYKALTQPSEGSKQVEQAGQVNSLPPVAKQIAQGAVRLFVPGIETFAKQVGTVIGSKGKELPSSLDAFMASADASLTFGSVGAVKIVSDILGGAGDVLVNKNTTLRITPEELRIKLANGEIQTPEAQAVAKEFIKKGLTIEARGPEPRGGVAQAVGEKIGGEIKPANPQFKVTQGQGVAGDLNSAFAHELVAPENKPFAHEAINTPFAHEIAPVKPPVAPETAIIPKVDNTASLSKPNEFYKQFYNSNDESTFIKVEAKPVDLGIKADTFIHRGTNGKGWIVTEGQTGTLISTGNTQVQAIQNAKVLVEKQGQQKFNQAIQQRIGQNGLTPRYSETKPTENSQAGFVSPSAISESVKGKITSAKDLIAQTKTGLTASSNLEDSLFKIKQAAKADKLQASELLKNSPMTNADAEAIYHYEENKSESLTPKQQELYQSEIKPLADESARIVAKLKPLIPLNEDTYTPRFIKGKGDVIDRMVAKGKASFGSQLSKSAPSLQKRTMKALVDDKGNRTVVSIKGGRVTGLTNKSKTDLGDIKIKTNEQLMNEDIKPIQKSLDILQRKLDGITSINIFDPVSKANMQSVVNQLNALSEQAFGVSDTAGGGMTKSLKAKQKLLIKELKTLETVKTSDKTTNIALKIRNIQTKMLELSNDMADIEKQYNPNELNNRKFVAKGGKTYKITDATTKEIEANTYLTYHHNALVNHTITYLKLKQVERAVDFLEAYKETPEFKTIAVEFGKGLAPDGWRPSSLRTFSGYVFEPHVAAVLDNFNKSLQSGGDPLKILTGVNSFLRTSIFFNPLIHVPNIANHWFVARGVTKFVNPKAYPKLLSTSVRAINAVMKQNSDYVEMLKSGANLMYADENVRNLNDLLLQKMSQNIETDPQLKFFRETFPNFVKWLNPYKISGKITWAVNDIATMQAIYEDMESGKTMEQAISEVGKHIPNYRVPANILGSESVSKFIKNPNITMFSAYHYGALKSYAETAKDVFKGSVGEKAKAFDRLAMLALITFVIYPQLDKLAKKVTGNAKAQFRRAGASTLIDQSLKLATGKIDAGQFLTTFLTPAPGTKETIQQIFNTDLFTGQKIRTPGQSGAEQLKESVTHAGLQVSPAQQYQRITSGSISGKDYVASLFGISSPKSTASEKILQNMVYDEKPKLQTQLKTLEEQGQDWKAQQIINDFNRRLKQTTLEAYKENGQQVPADLDNIIKAQLLKAPGAKAMQNLKDNKNKTPLEKLFK